MTGGRGLGRADVGTARGLRIFAETEAEVDLGVLSDALRSLKGMRVYLRYPSDSRSELGCHRA